MLSSLIFLILVFYNNINTSYAEDTKELGITYQTDAIIHFLDFDDVYLTFNVKRLFLDEVEYSYKIKGDLKWDSEMEMYTFKPILNDCKFLKTPFSNIPIQMQKIYGVFKLLNEKSGDEFIISILRDPENTDRIPAPKIRELLLPIKMPEEAIIMESENDKNFTNPEILYNYADIYERTFYIPFKLFNATQVRNIKYEVFYTYDRETTEVDANGNPFTSTLYQSLYAQDPDYRLAKVVRRSDIDTLFAEGDSSWMNFFIDPNNMWMTYKPDLTLENFSVIQDPNTRQTMIDFWNKDSILKRVVLIDEHINKFHDLSINVPLSDISGVSIETENNQISMSGKPGDETHDSKITFLAVYKDPDPELDRWIDVSKFEATNTEKTVDYKSGEIIKAPPLLLNWEVFPYKNVNIEIKNKDDIIYQGTESQVENYLVSNFAPGEYYMKMSNSLGSKMTSPIIVEAPDDSIEVFKVTHIKDDFGNNEQLEKIDTQVRFNKFNTSMEIAINVLGNPPKDIKIEPKDINQNQSLLIQENIEKRKNIYENYFTQYIYELRQISSDATDTEINITTDNLEKTFRVILAEDLKENRNIVNKTDITTNVNPKNKNWIEFFDNPYSEIMVFKIGTTQASFDKIKDEMLKQNLTSGLIKSEAKNTTKENNLKNTYNQKNEDKKEDKVDKEFIGKVLGISFSRKITNEEKDKSFVLLGIFFVVILSIGKKKKKKKTP